MPRHKNVHELLLAAAAFWSERVAFRHVIGTRVAEYRYGQIEKLTYRRAQILFSRGVRPGDRVAIWADNSPDWVLACLATWRLGAIAAPLESTGSAEEILRYVEEIEAKLMLAGDRQYLQVSDRLPAALLCHTSELEIEGSLPSLRALASPGRGDPALLVRTSGSVTRSRAAVLTHGNVLSSASALGRQLGISADDRVFSTFSLAHVFGLVPATVVPLSKGATIVYRGSGPDRPLRPLLKHERISVLFGSPPTFSALLAEIDQAVQELPRCRRLACAVVRRLPMISPAIVPLIAPEVHEEFGDEINFWLSAGAAVDAGTMSELAALGIPVRQAYGLTEASSFVSVSTRCDRLSTHCGTPLSGIEVRIDNPDESGQGEICLRGAVLMQEYWKDARATGDIKSDGWLRTGDRGFIGSEGCLNIAGRVASALTAGGGATVAQAVEARLAQSEMIKQACAFSRPGGGKDEGLCAVITVEPGMRLKPDWEARLGAEIERICGELPAHQRISDYQVWDHSLPLTVGGGIRRGEIRGIYEAQRSRKRTAVAYPSSRSGRTWDAEAQKLCRLLAEVADQNILKGISPSGSYLFAGDLALEGDLGLDSFARLELSVKLESELGVNVCDLALQSAQTVEDLLTLVRQPARLSTYAEADRPYAHQAADKPQWKPWPTEHYGYAVWPGRNDPLVVAARRTLGVGLKLFAHIYNDLKAVGKDRLLIDPPYIVAAGSLGTLEILALLALFPASLLKLVHPVVPADTWFSDPLLSALSAYGLNAVPFERSGSLKQALDDAKALLSEGHILIIDPEAQDAAGQRVVKSGVAHLALALNCPILPARVEGADRVLPDKEILPKAEPVKVTFGLPLYPPLAEPNLANSRALTARLAFALDSLKPYSAPAPTLR